MFRTRTPLPDTELALFYGDLAHNWRSMVGVGAIALMLGAFGLFASTALTLASVMVFGVLLLFGGLIQGWQVGRSRGWHGTIAHALIALLYVVAGISVIVDPVGASAFLTLGLASVILAVGVLRIFVAWQMRGQHSLVWPLVSGAVALVLGTFILLRWPSSGLWVIGLFISLELVAHGATLLAVALAARRVDSNRSDAASSPSSPERTPPFGPGMSSGR